MIKERKTTQKQLAEEINVGAVSLNRWIKNERTMSIEYLGLIAGYLDVDVNYLLGRTNDKTNWTKYDIEHKKQIEQLTNDIKLWEYIDSLAINFNIYNYSDEELDTFEKEIREFIKFKVSQLNERKGECI